MPICTRNQFGLSSQRTLENVSSRHCWFLSNFPPHKTNYPPFQIAKHYIKNKEKVYGCQIFSILAITRVDSQMLISQLCISSLCWFFSRKGSCNLSTTTWRKRISVDWLQAKEPNLWFFTGQVAILWPSQISFFRRQIIFQVAHFVIYRPISQPCL